jgi:flagellar biosynthetic protein FliR
MISVTSVELNAWIAALLYPLARILAVLATAPPFSNRALPMRTRLALGLAIAFAVAPGVAIPPGIIPGSGAGLAVLAQQMLIGFAMGFAIRIAFAAISMAGEIIGLQMGLGFATFYDPLNTAQTPVVAEFIGILATLVFIAINGHLMIIATIAESFAVLPVGAPLPQAESWSNLARTGSLIFASGVLISLPVVAALLITNVALGVLSRAAPQLSLFAVGFPLTLTGGFVVLILSLGYFADPLTRLFEQVLGNMLSLFVPARPA